MHSIQEQEEESQRAKRTVEELQKKLSEVSDKLRDSVENSMKLSNQVLMTQISAEEVKNIALAATGHAKELAKEKEEAHRKLEEVYEEFDREKEQLLKAVKWSRDSLAKAQEEAQVCAKVQVF
jgi:DNA integrity scanning protein DisA with diadenylate cyclase activity